jgi:hypothetical protein
MLHYLLLLIVVCLIVAAMVIRADVSEGADVGLLFAVIAAMVLAVVTAPADRGGQSSWNVERVSPRSSPARLPGLSVAPIPGVEDRTVDPELRQRAAYREV